MINIADITQKILENYIIGLALIIFILGLIAYPVKSALIWLIENYLRKTNIISEEISLKEHFHPGIWFIFVLLGFRIFQPLVEIPQAQINVIDKIWQVAIVLAFTFFFIRMVNLLKEIITRRYDVSVKDNLEQRKVLTQIDFVERIIVAVLLIIGFCVILMNFEGAKKLGTSLMASAGLAGIMIGFAAQKTLSNLIAGFQIAFTQPFRLDDVVIVEGEWGWIEEITLTYVVVRIWDKRRLVVPINYLLDKPFQNWTRNEAEILGYIYLYMDYSVPLEGLRKEFQRLVESSNLWNGKVAGVQVTDSTDKTQEIRFLVSSDDSSKAWDLRCYLREHLINFIQKNYPESLPKYRVSALAEKFQVLN
ncbi:MAG: mechanosensitive ion channel [Candidatus Aenigmarchaeota archaeon]|nr:mechanosensitive ion channel [Candidatus Aenigmarchaeota archaeon]